MEKPKLPPALLELLAKGLRVLLIVLPLAASTYSVGEGWFSSLQYLCGVLQGHILTGIDIAKYVSALLILSLTVWIGIVVIRLVRMGRSATLGSDPR